MEYHSPLVGYRVESEDDAALVIVNGSGADAGDAVMEPGVAREPLEGESG